MEGGGTFIPMKFLMTESLQTGNAASVLTCPLPPGFVLVSNEDIARQCVSRAKPKVKCVYFLQKMNQRNKSAIFTELLFWFRTAAPSTLLLRNEKCWEFSPSLLSVGGVTDFVVPKMGIPELSRRFLSQSFSESRFADSFSSLFCGSLCCVHAAMDTETKHIFVQNSVSNISANS